MTKKEAIAKLEIEMQTALLAFTGAYALVRELTESDRKRPSKTKVINGVKIISSWAEFEKHKEK